MRFMVMVVLTAGVLAAHAAAQALPHAVTVGTYAPDGSPLDGSEVRVTSYRLQHAGNPPPQSGLSCQTDAVGACALVLTPGSYKVSVFTPHARTDLQPVTVLTVKVRSPRVVGITVKKAS